MDPVFLCHCIVSSRQLAVSVSITRCVNFWLCVVVLVEVQQDDDAEAVVDGKLNTEQQPETVDGASGTSC